MSRRVTAELVNTRQCLGKLEWCVCVSVCLSVCVCVCVCVCVLSLVCMVGVIFVYVDTVYGFFGYLFYA